MGLVLSLFPGIGLLDMAFEQAGFCVVRGPDVLWGGDVRRFHPPAGCFDGVIGGPPCQRFSRLAHMVKANGHELALELRNEVGRVVAEAAPVWFLMENVQAAPEALAWSPAVCASGGVKPGIPTDRKVRAKYLGWKTATALAESIRLQGLPADFLDKAPFTLEGKHKVVGNGVPLPTGHAIAHAVRAALQAHEQRRAA